MSDRHQPDLARSFDEFAALAAAKAAAHDLHGVRVLARRRRRARWAVVAVAALVALATPTLVYVLIGRAGPSQPVGGGIPTSAPPVSTASTTPIDEMDWANATFVIPPNQTGCAAGTARFHDSVAEVGGTRYRLGGPDPANDPRVAYGDVDRDGEPEALVVASCITPEGRFNPPSVLLLVDGQDGLRTLGLAFSARPRQPDGEGENYVSTLEVRPDGVVVATIRTWEGTGRCLAELAWTGSSFTGPCQGDG